ncbi:hypothetical protein F5I97DRAFT_1469133 [Phlebopus sp. FC_14]|nr:hypothetical protein F5I97DRAFT_1469133 [Phlebopus sp. FC_14]
MHTPKVWFVTGASSGFGRSMTEFVLSQDDIVVATLRKPEALNDLAARYPAEKLLVLKVDVTKQEDVDHAFARTKEVFGRLDVVFNNAGYAVFGEAEGTPASDARAMFDVNFWGLASVSRAAIQFFRESNEPGKGGVLLQMSSIAALASPPGVSFYAATKHAVEGFSESLAQELLPSWNIKICIIEPGGFNTNATASATILPQHPAYTSSATALSRAALPGAIFDGDADKFTKTVYRMATGNDIPLRLPMGHDALGALTAKVEELSSVVVEAALWSADLKRDGVDTPAV